MTTFTVKGIPDDLYQRLKERAAAHRRSINSELIVCLERALLGDRIDPEQMLARADAVRERLEMRPYTQAALNAAKNRGRP